MASEQIERLEDSLGDLQELAGRIDAGTVCREDVLWRLRSYFHVVGFLGREFEQDVSDDDQVLAASRILGEIQGLVSELILDLADQELSVLEEEKEVTESLVSKRQAQASLACIIPFPFQAEQTESKSDDRW